MPSDDGLAHVLLLQRRVSLGALLEFEVLPRVAGAALHLEGGVLVEVDDLDLRRNRVDDVSLVGSSAPGTATDQRCSWMTIRSIFACAAALKAGFLTIVSCVPFCQLWNLNGPLEMSIEFDQSLLKSCPATLCAGRAGVAEEDVPGRVRATLLEGDGEALALHLDLRDVLPALTRHDVPGRVHDRLVRGQEVRPCDGLAV